MVCRGLLLAAGAVWAAVLAGLPEDEVPLIQQTAQGAIWQPESAAEDEVLAGLATAIHLQDALVDFLLPPKERAATALSEADPSGAKPVPLGAGGMCSESDHARFKAKVTELVSKKDFKLPAACPVVKDMGQMIPALKKVGACLATLFGISEACADCHQTFLSSLPGCLPTCGLAAFSCPTKPTTSELPKKCWAGLGRCLRCTAPMAIKNMKCVGDAPKEAYKLVDEFTADVTDGSIVNNATLEAFLKHTAQALR